MWGIRVIVPSKLRERVLTELHTGHPGIVKMKSVARTLVWWLGIDEAFESFIQKCYPCQSIRNKTAPTLLHPWRKDINFAVHGLPCQIVSDNGPQFSAHHFKDFLKQNGIKHIHSSPYHPATNREAERFVQTFKNAMKSAKYDSGTLEIKLAHFLLMYRIHQIIQRSNPQHNCCFIKII